MLRNLAACFAALSLAASVPAQVKLFDQKPRWCHDAEGSADLGLWQGEKFLGRYFSKEKTYRPWTGKSYGPPAPVPGPHAVVPVFYMAPMSSCPGGFCPGNR